MNNEKTIIEKKNKSTSSISNKQSEKDNSKASNAKKIIFATAGAGVAYGVNVIADGQDDEAMVNVVNPYDGVGLDDNAVEAKVISFSYNKNKLHSDESIVAIPTGIRVAQVDDNKTFPDAFAEARNKVGAGGVFEWRGKVYGTYYEDEWNAMTSQERQEFQSSINYNDIINSSNINQYSDSNNIVVGKKNISESNNNESEYGNDIKVVSIGKTDFNDDGKLKNAAILNVHGQEVLVVDVDKDNNAEIALVDINGDGKIDEREIVDISEFDIGIPNADYEDSYITHGGVDSCYMDYENI